LALTGGTNTFTSTGETEINCDALDINAGTGSVTIDTTENITINSDYLNINTTQDITLDADSDLYINASTAGNTNIGNSGTIALTGNILVQQSTYPPSNTSALGYNVTTTATEHTFTADTLSTITSFTVPSKGVWSCSISVKYRTTGGAGSFENVQLFLTDSASGTTAYRTFEYFDETDVSVGANGKRFVHTISGTLTTTASTTFYIRGINDTTGITTLAEAIYSYTRVG